MTILETIKDVYPRLTKKQKLIADYMQDNADTMTFVTLRDLSRELNVSELTILNMCKGLGYKSFNEVKYEFRKCIGESRKELYQSGGYYTTDLPDYELSRKEQLLADIAREEMGLMEDLLRRFDSKELLEAADMFFSHSRVVLCGRGISLMICETLRSALAVSGMSCLVVNTELNEQIYSALPAIDKKTLVVVVSFPDYYYMTEKMAAFAKKRHAAVLCITDTREAEITQFADMVLTAGSTTRLALNTLSAPMALANLLYSAIFISKEEKKDDRTDEFSSLF